MEEREVLHQLLAARNKLINQYGWGYNDVMEMSIEKLISMLTTEEKMIPLADREKLKELMDKAQEILLDGKEVGSDDDYINIRIPKKGDVPIVEFEGKEYGAMPEEALESIKFVWVTKDEREHAIENPYLDIKYLASGSQSKRRVSLGDETVAEHLRETVNQLVKDYGLTAQQDRAIPVEDVLRLLKSNRSIDDDE